MGPPPAARGSVDGNGSHCTGLELIARSRANFQGGWMAKVEAVFRRRAAKGFQAGDDGAKRLKRDGRCASSKVVTGRTTRSTSCNQLQTLRTQLVLRRDVLAEYRLRNTA